MKRLVWMTCDVILLGVTAKVIAPMIMLSPFDLLVCFTFVKVADIQYRLHHKQG